jgi:hypothetical protein
MDAIDSANQEMQLQIAMIETEDNDHHSISVT